MALAGGPKAGGSKAGGSTAGDPGEHVSESVDEEASEHGSDEPYEEPNWFEEAYWLGRNPFTLAFD